MTNKFLFMIEMKLLLGFIHDTGPPTPAPPTCIVWTTFLCFIYIFISTRLTPMVWVPCGIEVFSGVTVKV